MVLNDFAFVSVLKKYASTLTSVSFYLGLLLGCTSNPNMPSWLTFGLLTLIIVGYCIFVRPLGHKVERELSITMTLRDIAIDQVGRSNESVSRALLSEMTGETKPWMTWIAEQHPGDCRVLAEVAKKMIAEQTDPKHWRDENLSDLHAALVKRSQEKP